MTVFAAMHMASKEDTAPHNPSQSHGVHNQMRETKNVHLPIQAIEMSKPPSIYCEKIFLLFSITYKPILQTYGSVRESGSKRDPIFRFAEEILYNLKIAKTGVARLDIRRHKRGKFAFPCCFPHPFDFLTLCEGKVHRPNSTKMIVQSFGEVVFRYEVCPVFAVVHRFRNTRCFQLFLKSIYAKGSFCHVRGPSMA